MTTRLTSWRDARRMGPSNSTEREGDPVSDALHKDASAVGLRNEDFRDRLKI